MLQDRLGIAQCAEMEIHSNCSGVGKAVQIAYDALRVGRYRTALVVYAQLSSVYLRSCYLNQPTMNKKQATLRYILADGSGALVLRAVDTSNGGPLPHEILGTHLESVGCGRKPGMTAGGGMADMVPADGSPLSLYNAGRHHLDQDFAVVSQQAVPYLAQGVEHMLAALGVATASVDHYIYSVPGRQLYEANLKRVTEPFGVTAERVQFRAAQTGYCGGASVLIHLDEMVRSGELRPGQSAVVYSVESSKWMSGGFLLRW
jgi:3-oxoacyl-[acyl-carrier-protein] synthase-3